ATAVLFFLFILVIFIGEATGSLPDDVKYSIPAAVAGAMAFGYLFLLSSLRREGFSIGQSQAALWREPSWSPLWYRRALRRRGNVWDRLPAAVRYLRSCATAFFGFHAVLTVGIVVLEVSGFDCERLAAPPAGARGALRA